MTQNRFEQVDGLADDVLMLTLRREGEKRLSIVSCPSSATDGRPLMDFACDEIRMARS